MDYHGQCSKLVQIIQNFRHGELDFEIDESHVDKWISQFACDSQAAILQETIYILRDWYFNREYLRTEYIEKVLSFLMEEYHFRTMSELCKGISFVNIQEVGNSQKQLWEMLSSSSVEQYGVSIINAIEHSISHYVYIDDGLYTGSRARKDIYKLLQQLPAESILDVFFLIAGSNGLYYANRELQPFAAERKISLHIHTKKRIYNNHFVHKASMGHRVEETYDPTQSCLWPYNLYQSDQVVEDYVKTLEAQATFHKRTLYRSYPWSSDKGVFSSVANRNIVEKEFLHKGIDIVSRYADNKGIYPLGYNLWPSFGFGSFCASDLNISNTCHVVLWSTNGWYPLLPRRINESGDKEFNDAEWDEIFFSRDQHPYTMCPDCGNLFGIEDDGGNGFCINCARKH